MRNVSLFLIVFLTTGFLGSIGGTSTVSNQHEMVYVSAEQQKMSTIISKTDETLQIKKQLHNEQVNCMAKNIFFEAAVESTAGKLAVAQVTLNRVNSTWYPNTVCEVVYEGSTYTASDGQQLPRRDRCQFSWYCDGKDDIPPTNSRSWDSSFLLAQYVLKNKDNLVDITDGALHYHARYIEAPFWTKKKKVTAVIDQHIFYKSITH
jgi:N-acetylmuramoyl-L-alanine amidase